MKWYEDKEYQEMCEGAEKIQKKWKPNYGDILYIDNPSMLVDLAIHKERYPNFLISLNEGGTLALLCNSTCMYEYLQKRFIWLPPQEDLQEMVSSDLRIKLFDSNPALMSLKLFYDRVSQDEYFWQFKSYSQLWLAFVMHKLYQKKWDPETQKWEKRET